MKEHEYWPKDTKDNLHIESGSCATGKKLWDKIQDKWPGIEMGELEFTAEHIHTDFLNYDVYVRGDYTDFICIKAMIGYFSRIAPIIGAIMAEEGQREVTPGF